jgi:hypothetical protein
VQEAARAKRVQLLILKAGTESEIDAAFASFVQLHASALLVGNDPFFCDGPGCLDSFRGSRRVSCRRGAQT